MSPTPEQPGLPNLPSTGRSDRKKAQGKEPLQVRIPTGVKRRFKAHAAMRGIDPHELFVEVWEFYERSHAAAESARKGEET